ncbi:MAG: sigma-70 family RNA polymerase sigma factor [Candidatus Latescibacterota bacterium]
MSDNTTGNSDRPDVELVKVINRGRDSAPGRAAAAELLGRYRRPVYVWCYRYVGEHEHALDLSQDVLMRAWQSLESFEGRSKFSSWLFAIARNRCLNEVRRVKLFDDDEPDFDRVPAGRTNPAIDFEEGEDENRLIGLIAKTLEPLEQKALWLRCLERLPVDEITKILEIDAASGARGVLQKARRKLRSAIERGDWDVE